LAGGTWLRTAWGVPCLNNRKRKAEHSFSIKENQIWVIREVRIKAEGNIKCKGKTKIEKRKEE
jgi:hypothetical protein